MNLFREIDADQDGFISLRELREALDRYTGRNYEQYFQKYDRDSDAKISFEGMHASALSLSLHVDRLSRLLWLCHDFHILEFKNMITKY